jgi:phosphatidylglycerophosphatase A
MYRWLILASASWLGLGYLPRAPGTWGTLGAIPLWWAMARLAPWESAVITALIALASIWIAHQAERIYGAHDVQHIVIDEVAGMLVAAIGVPFAWPEVVAAFVLFRLFDMVKPGPIRWLDQNVGGGLGVVLDDIAAGAAASGVLWSMRLILGGWW